MADSKKVQPKSPQGEGVDPLTKGEKLHSKDEPSTFDKESTGRDSNKASNKTVKQQEQRNAKANTPVNKPGEGTPAPDPTTGHAPVEGKDGTQAPEKTPGTEGADSTDGK